METKKSLSYISRAMTLAILSSPLAVLTPADALPEGMPRDRCGTLSNPQPGTLCYTVTQGGGKVNAGGSPKEFPPIIIQATEPEYVIADVILDITSSAGDRNLPSVSQLSPGGQASIVSVAKEKLQELKQIRGELQAKATVLSGSALIEAQAKLSALQEQERIYESVVTTTTAAGQDAGKFQVGGASARSRSCGIGNFDTCGSWVEYNVYTVKRYVGNPIAAYDRAFAIAQDAQNTITRLVAQNQQPPTSQLSNVVIASYQAAFGRTPTQEELDYWLGRNRQETVNMDMLMFNHRNWLKGGNEINETIVRSYQAILSRSPKGDEINYWRSRISTDGLTYTDLIRAHQDWKSRGGT